MFTKRIIGSTIACTGVLAALTLASSRATADDARLAVAPAVYRTAANDAVAGNDHAATIQLARWGGGHRGGWGGGYRGGYGGYRGYGYRGSGYGYRPYYGGFGYGLGYGLGTGLGYGAYGYPGYGYGYPAYGYGNPGYGYGGVGVGIW